MSDQLYRRCKHGSFVAHEQITDRGTVSDCEGVVLVNPDYAAAEKVFFSPSPIGRVWKTKEYIRDIVDAALKGTDYE